MIFYNTFKCQIELLPRITILYGDEEKYVEPNGIGLEWLWFGMFIYFNRKK